MSFGSLLIRKVITYLVTCCLLGASFGAVYGLSLAQIENQGNQVLSVIISLVISIINVIIGQVIRKLSVIEMDYTETKHQTSLAMKSILAQLINSILIPMVVARYIKKDIYSDNGLAADIFMLGLTNSLIPPVLKIFDIGYIISRIKKSYYEGNASIFLS